MIFNSEQLPVEFFQPKERTQLAWLGMAGVICNAHGTIVLIDPLLSLVENDGQTFSEAGFEIERPLPITADAVTRVDLVCYTHGDHDHLGQITAYTLANQTNCRFLAPPPVARTLSSLGIPDERIQIAHDDDHIRLGEVEITITPALHNWQAVDPWQRGDCCGYLLRTPDGSLWHPGDTRFIDDLYAYRNVDVLFFDVADVDSHLGPTGSAQLAQSCGAKVVIPYHYWSFGKPPGEFAVFEAHKLAQSAAGLSARIEPLHPGQVYDLSQAQY